jgi:hypothetical protein
MSNNPMGLPQPVTGIALLFFRKRPADNRPTKWVLKKQDLKMWIDFNGNCTPCRFLVDTETNLQITEKTGNYFTR